MSDRVAVDLETGDLRIAAPGRQWVAPMRVCDPDTGAVLFNSGSAWRPVGELLKAAPASVQQAARCADGGRNA